MVCMTIKKADKVIVISGKDKGKTGEVLKAMPRDHKILVQGVNLVKKHQRPTQEAAGGIISKELPIDVSNVALIDPKSGKATRVGSQVKDGRKVRVAKRSGEIIEE
ncbi:MAG: 50S ribosomal protein L24 [Alphaproteobacteria bacterium]|nr:50S ribosomal protein L24 [Alphaproteobacteria bacterium]